MTRTFRWAVPVAAIAAVLLAGTGPAAASGRAGHPGAPPALSNHLISGNETSISCLTRARCVAVGVSPHGAQVVSLYNGRQTRVSVLRYRAPLLSVSCAGKAGCWAIGMLPTNAAILVKIGSAGQVTKVIKVSVPSGDALFQISCRTMTACQILGSQDSLTPVLPVFFFSPWNGKKWRLDSFGLDAPGSSAVGFSCWRTTCVVIGWDQFDSASGEAYALVFNNGIVGVENLKGLKTTFNAISCSSTTTCYAVGSSHGTGVAVTISGGVPSATNNPMPLTAGAIACVRATCWATGGNQIVKLRGGVVIGTPLTDKATTGFGSIIAHGNGYIAIGGSAKQGDSVVLIS